MIFLLNPEYVVWEVVEMARIQICEVLKVSTGKVEATIDLADGKLSPEFLVDMDYVEGITPDEVREVMRHIYADCKEEMKSRLKGVTKSREDVLIELRGGEPESLIVRFTPKKSVWLWAVIRWKLIDAMRWIRLIWGAVWRRLRWW